MKGSEADWTLKPRLLAVEGVAKCSTFGGEVRQLQIQVQPDRLVAYDLAISDVIAAARLATGVMGAGYVETENQRVIVQTEGQSLNSDLLGEVVILHTNNISVRLKDVARVVEGAEPKFGDTLIQGQPGVLMTMSSQYGANTRDVTRRLEAALAEMKPVLEKQGIKLYPRLHRPATFIEVSLKNIRSSLYLGGILVAIVLFLFLGHFRTAFISLTAIPLSLLTAIILLDRFGVTLNTITLGGLAIAIGEVVDDAIIDVENIFRRLRENQLLATPRPAFNVILDASLEVRTAVVYATFIVALVFLPVLTLTGLQGKFFAPLALSYILAIMASLAVALTLTPALCYLFFGRGVRSSKEPRVQTWLKAQNDYTRAALTRIPGRNDLLARIRQLDEAATARVFDVRRLPGGRYMYQKRLATEDVAKLYVREGLTGDEKVLVDPVKLSAPGEAAHVINYYGASFDGAYVAYGASPGGSEDAVIHVIETAT